MSNKLKITTKFDIQYKLMNRSCLKSDISELDSVIQKLLNGKKLDPKYQDHELSGNWKGHRECHIEPDWLLIYKIDNGNLILTAIRDLCTLKLL